VSDEGAEFLRGIFERSDDLTAQAEAFVGMLRRHGQLEKRADVTYRCPRRCALARVYLTAQGMIVHTSRYKLSPEANTAGSVASARAKRTEDGDRRWRPQTYFLSQALNVTLNCDHLRHVVLDSSRVEADAATRRGTVEVARGDDAPVASSTT
jgi:hypothetical protein